MCNMKNNTKNASFAIQGREKQLGRTGIPTPSIYNRAVLAHNIRTRTAYIMLKIYIIR